MKRNIRKQRFKNMSFNDRSLLLSFFLKWIQLWIWRISTIHSDNFKYPRADLNHRVIHFAEKVYILTQGNVSKTNWTSSILTNSTLTTTYETVDWTTEIKLGKKTANKNMMLCITAGVTLLDRTKKNNISVRLTFKNCHGFYHEKSTQKVPW